MVATLLASLVLGSQELADISRVYAKGEKLNYNIQGDLVIEQRVGDLKTFLVEDFGIQYAFTGEVTQMKTDGICDIRYKRPSMTEIEGETPESPEKKKVTKMNLDYLLTVSPVNEILKMEDLTPKPPKKAGFVFPTKEESNQHLSQRETAASRAIGWKFDPSSVGMTSLDLMPDAAVQLNQYQQEIFRLALCVGNFDTSLDLSPKLPFEEVKVGETWKKTATYAPQVIKGKGKSAVQRLDYTYTYEGIVDSESGKKVHRVKAILKLDTDIAPFINGLLEMKPEQSGLKAMALKLDQTILWDLDLKTRKTLLAVAEAKGESNVVLTRNPSEPYQEMRIKGRTTMTPKG